MPHKKAKRSVRDEQRLQQGTNLAPGKESIVNEALPKSAARVLNALDIRNAYNKNKRKLEQDGGSGREKNGDKRRKIDEFELKIKPGESIQHFYRRVEDDMRPVVRSAVQASKAVERKTHRDELEAQKKKKKEAKAAKSQGARPTPKVSREQSPPPPPPLSSDRAQRGPKRDEKTERPKEFETFSTSAPRRLNNVAEAPPEFDRLPRGATRRGGKREEVLSMAQKSAMEQEREKAIARYRLLKASRLRSVET